MTDGPSTNAIGRTRLGNPPNGNAPIPRGAVRILMIGDLIGKPGRVAVEQLLPGLRQEPSAAIDAAGGVEAGSDGVLSTPETS